LRIEHDGMKKEAEVHGDGRFMGEFEVAATKGRF
jgi:hypothetical protein